MLKIGRIGENPIRLFLFCVSPMGFVRCLSNDFRKLTRSFSLFPLNACSLDFYNVHTFLNRGIKTMNHITVRRMALTAASVSFSVLTALVLVVSAAFGDDLLAVNQSVVQTSFSEDSVLEFPTPISCTSVIVESVASYDGPFYEDGTGREVINVAAILLRNTGDEMIPYVHIILRTESASYLFDGFWIPAGAAVLIPEKYALPYEAQQEFISCFGWATVWQQTNSYAISFEEISMGKILVRNRSDTDIKNLTLYHKTYLQENDMYIGGVAFESRIDFLGIGETVVFSPKNYASGYSKLIYYE